MKYATPAAFRTALDQRLKTEAEHTGIALGRLRKRITFELFLRRLVKVAPSRWVLKGAFALDLRLDVATRPTKDIDIGRDDDTDSAIEDITAAQQLDLGDFFSFVATRTAAFDDIDEFNAIRFHVRAELAGRIFEQFIVDIGFTDRLTWTPDTIKTSNLLAFADIAPIEVPAVPLAQHVAEKVRAYTRRYGKQQRPSTRPKDLVDILLISGVEPMDATALREALERTSRSERASRYRKHFLRHRANGSVRSRSWRPKSGSIPTSTLRSSSQRLFSTRYSPSRRRGDGILPPCGGSPARRGDVAGSCQCGE
jgi:predicted nucleotidyltransferase component of viral defense system